MIYMFEEGKCMFLCFMHYNANSLSKMTKLVWRYSDDAGAIIESVYKFCMKETKSGMNRVWDRTAGLSRR